MLEFAPCFGPGAPAERTPPRRWRAGSCLPMQRASGLRPIPQPPIALHCLRSQQVRPAAPVGPAPQAGLLPRLLLASPPRHPTASLGLQRVECGGAAPRPPHQCCRVAAAADGGSSGGARFDMPCPLRFVLAGVSAAVLATLFFMGRSGPELEKPKVGGRCVATWGTPAWCTAVRCCRRLPRRSARLYTVAAAQLESVGFLYTPAAPSSQPSPRFAPRPRWPAGGG